MPQAHALQINRKSVFTFLVTTMTVLVLMISMAFAQSSGGFKNQEYKVKGTWSIETRADGAYLVISDDFKTRRAPDLKFFLSKNNYDQVTGDNATQGAVLVSALSSTKGAQSYKIPKDVSLADYQSLVLHCEQYGKLWASTPLK